MCENIFVGHHLHVPAARTRRASGRVWAAAIILFLSAGTWAEDPYDVAWIRQIGTTEHDHNSAVVVDASDNVYLSGHTHGDLAGPNAGGDDIFLSRFDSLGNPVWTRQFGTPVFDWSASAAADAVGNVYVAGWTEGDLGGTSAGGGDLFLRKYDSGGNPLWTTQIGSSENEWCEAITVGPSGNVYVSGITNGDFGGTNAGAEDAYLAKFDSSGNELWTVQFGKDEYDRGRAVAVDSSENVYITVDTDHVGSPDPFEDFISLKKLDSAGNELWTHQISTSSDDSSTGLAVDVLGNVYVSGSTQGNLGGPNAGSYDAFVGKFDAAGNELWITQFGTTEWDRATSLVVDASGLVYIGGHTRGDLGGPNAGETDAILGKLDVSGNVLWIDQIGTDTWDSAYAVALSPLGNVYISGFTHGDLGEPGASGNSDVFLARYEVPEPVTMGLLALGGLTLLKRRK